MDKKNFTLPVASKCRTFISFHFLNPETNTNKRFRKYVPKSTSPEMWNDTLRSMIEEWTLKLRSGYNPFREQQEADRAASPYYVDKIVQEICDERVAYLRTKTKSTYQSKVTIFTDWLKRNNYTKIYAADFTKEDADKFLKWLSDTKGRNLSPTSRNTYMITLRTIWKTMQDKEIVRKNPWTETAKIKENRLGKLPLKAEMKKTLIRDFAKEDPELWLFVQFMYYCFIRPGELIKLKVGAIDLDDEKILIDADISKNHKSEYVIIPTPFADVLRELKINKYKHSYYVFSPDKCPGEKPYSKDVFNRRHKTFTDRKGYNRRYTLYSWKHTGACDVAMKGANIKQLQMQLRHADLQTTDIYLRSLGINDMKDISQKFPSLV